MEFPKFQFVAVDSRPVTDHHCEDPISIGYCLPLGCKLIDKIPWDLSTATETNSSSSSMCNAPSSVIFPGLWLNLSTSLPGSPELDKGFQFQSHHCIPIVHTYVFIKQNKLHTDLSRVLIEVHPKLFCIYLTQLQKNFFLYSLNCSAELNNGVAAFRWHI